MTPAPVYYKYIIWKDGVRMLTSEKFTDKHMCMEYASKHIDSIQHEYTTELDFSILDFNSPIMEDPTEIFTKNPDDLPL